MLGPGRKGGGMSRRSALDLPRGVCTARRRVLFCPVLADPASPLRTLLVDLLPFPHSQGVA